MYSAPELRAARSKEAVMRTSSLACSNSREWWEATLGSPITLSRSRGGRAAIRRVWRGEESGNRKGRARR
eukprot:3042411-Pleurochrysis_carterae.AAC.1